MTSFRCLCMYLIRLCYGTRMPWINFNLMKILNIDTLQHIFGIYTLVTSASEVTVSTIKDILCLLNKLWQKCVVRTPTKRLDRFLWIILCVFGRNETKTLKEMKIDRKAYFIARGDYGVHIQNIFYSNFNLEMLSKYKFITIFLTKFLFQVEQA